VRPLLVAPLAVALLAAPATAAPRRTPVRTIVAQYTVSGVGGVIRGGAGAQGSTVGAVYVPLRASERYVRVSLSDDSGMSASAEIALDLDGDELADEYLATFCGETENPVRIPRSDATLIVYPVVGRCGGTASSATQGTATIQLSPGNRF
jgi:hypothetical protein